MKKLQFVALYFAGVSWSQLLPDETTTLRPQLTTGAGDGGACSLTCTDTQRRLRQLEQSVQRLTNENEYLSDRLTSLQNQVNGPIKALASCQEHYENGERKNGAFLIQPSLNSEPFEVKCAFDGNEVETSITGRHEHWPTFTATPGLSNGCFEPGCFTDTIHYNASIDQIESLMGISAHCLQHVWFNCTSNAITDFAWWTGRNGEKVSYWNGDKAASEQGCACWDTDDCDSTHGHVTKCNCDSLDEINIDHGIITSMAQLPIMGLAFGDSDRRYSWIHYQISNFKCYGKKSMYPSEIVINDFAFKSAVDQSVVISNTSDVSFGHAIMDRSLGATEGGFFTSPVAGHFEFTVQLQLAPSSLTATHSYAFQVDVIHNDVVVDAIYDNTEGSSYVHEAHFKTINYKIELEIEKGDTLRFKTASTVREYITAEGCRTGDIEHHCSWFAGRQVQEM